MTVRTNTQKTSRHGIRQPDMPVGLAEQDCLFERGRRVDGEDGPGGLIVQEFCYPLMVTRKVNELATHP